MCRVYLRRTDQAYIDKLHITRYKHIAHCFHSFIGPHYGATSCHFISEVSIYNSAIFCKACLEIWWNPHWITKTLFFPATQKGHMCHVCLFLKAILFNANLDKLGVHMEVSSFSDDVYLTWSPHIETYCIECLLVSLMIRPNMQSYAVSQFTHSLRGFPQVHR